MPDGPRGVARIVAAVEPFDEVEHAQQADVLAWLDSTPDVYRHTDVSLWYLLAGSPALPIALDPREFARRALVDRAADRILEPRTVRPEHGPFPR